MRETQGGRAGRGEEREHNGDKIEEKNEMGECWLEGQKRRRSEGGSGEVAEAAG